MHSQYRLYTAFVNLNFFLFKGKEVRNFLLETWSRF